jgi:hypothetical protein
MEELDQLAAKNQRRIAELDIKKEGINKES